MTNNFNLEDTIADFVKRGALFVIIPAFVAAKKELI
jgi:hypothetical protein